MSTKISEELIASLGTAAEARGVSRNHLVREALEAVVEGRVRHLTDEERASRRLQAVRELPAQRGRGTIQGSSLRC